MNCFRMIRGYVEHANTPGGAVAYIGALAPWDHVFKDTLYATQEIFGDAVAVWHLLDTSRIIDSLKSDLPVLDCVGP